MEMTLPPADTKMRQDDQRKFYSNFTHGRSKSNCTDTSSGLDLNVRTTDADNIVADSMNPSRGAQRALGEWHSNRQDTVPMLSRDKDKQISPSKSSIKSTASPSKSINRDGMPCQAMSPSKRAKKTKSITSFASILTRPKSSKDLRTSAREEDKENCGQPEQEPQAASARTPIYAQFCQQEISKSDSTTSTQHLVQVESNPIASTKSSCESKTRPRPKAVMAPDSRSQERGEDGSRGRRLEKDVDRKTKSSWTWLGARSASRPRSKREQPAYEPQSEPSSSKSRQEEVVMSDTDVETHLEALLDRRNIPESQRYKMRNLTKSIKLELIKQDWAETSAKPEAQALSADDVCEPPIDTPSTGDQCIDSQEAGKKTGRGRGFTLTKSTWRSASKSPAKSKSYHSRNKSTDSVITQNSVTTSGPSSPTKSGFLAKVAGQQYPGDYVLYLRKVQSPQAVEVGKLHKLRLLLRNERVAWTEDFIRQGGMKEIVGLLHRILEVEWREEHEDALLHEDLLCLKALCTTDLAIQYLHSIRESLMPAIIHMIFDPEKKGPSEFTTRGIVTSVLLTYIQHASTEERVERAATVLSYLRDPEDKDKQPLDFVMDMRRERPYKAWNKEFVNVTKEVFWIFLHNLNVVSLPAPQNSEAPTPTTYMQRHFPQERPPVPAAPYVGGVEWDATNYLASHLDLLNAIMACTTSSVDRNHLREQLQLSGWERTLGGSLRLCKEKFYPCVHDALRSWVAAAADDGWDVRDVRYGPPADAKSPRKKAKSSKEEVASPRLEMPKIDFAFDAPL